MKNTKAIKIEHRETIICPTKAIIECCRNTNAKASIILNHVRNADRVKDMIAQVQRGSIMFDNPNTTQEEKKEFWLKLANVFYKNKIPQYVIDFFNS